MVVHSVTFEGTLVRSYLRFKVNENYCTIRTGHWRFRLDSLVATVDKPTKVHFILGCNLLRSQQHINDVVVQANTPLHIFSLSHLEDAKANVTLLKPGQTEWFEFNNGSQEVELSFREVGPTITAPIANRLYVAGVMHFECLG
jgi:hypothetical protein